MRHAMVTPLPNKNSARVCFQQPEKTSKSDSKVVVIDTLFLAEGNPYKTYLTFILLSESRSAFLFGCVSIKIRAHPFRCATLDI